MEFDTQYEQAARRAEAEYRHLFQNHFRRWNLKSQDTWDEEYERRKLESSLETLGTLDQLDEMMALFETGDLRGPDGISGIFREYLKALREDAGDCLTADENLTLQNCSVSFHDLSLVNASVTNRNTRKQTLPFHLIFLNEGLYFCVQRLITAQIYEDMQGDYAQFKGGGVENFESACAIYQMGSSAHIQKGSKTFPTAEIQGDIEAHIANGSTMVMKFFLLHEIGHAHLDHLTTAPMQSLVFAMGQDQGSDALIDPVRLEQEFDADRFALTAVTRPTKTPESAWANFYVIRMFFKFMDVIETHAIAKTLKDHPPASTRIERLHDALVAEKPMPAGFDEIFADQDEMIKKWSQHMLDKGIFNGI